MTRGAASPAASGPAGALFEAQVGASYLLAMLVGAPPRGLPGTRSARVEFQRAGEGRPLDDVVVHATEVDGSPATLEVQVKRGITFAPSDQEFRDVVAQIAVASRRPDFWTTRYELGIATAKTTANITGAYQDVLGWARDIGDAATFMARITRPSSANDGMRSFVQTFRVNLQLAGAPSEDESVWRLLGRLQILVFDFRSVGSQSEETAFGRAVSVLHEQEADKAPALWRTLCTRVQELAVHGGDRDRAQLAEDLARLSFRLAGERRHTTARARLDEASRNALSDISDVVGGVRLTRHLHIANVRAALDAGRYVEIRGEAGVGKSGVLKHFAELSRTESSTIVLAPNRTPPHGWLALQATLGFEESATDLLGDLAQGGGGILFLDNLDFFPEDQRKTVSDLVRAASKVPGFAVIATARADFGREQPSWLPEEAVNALGRAEPIYIDDLSSAEAAELSYAAPRLATILGERHPAHEVSRNLFRLARLAQLSGTEPAPATEVDMGALWWRTADGGAPSERRDRSRVLTAMAEQTIAGTDPANVSAHAASAVDGLIASGSLRDLGSDRMSFRHDVLRDWAVASVLYERPELIDTLPLSDPAPPALVRGIDVTARMLLERSGDSAQWRALVERQSQKGVHGSWRRASLLAILHSEKSLQLLTSAAAFLLAGRAEVLSELIHLVMAVDVQPAKQVLAHLGLDLSNIPATLNMPTGASWGRLIVWLLVADALLPGAAIPDVVDLYAAWAPWLPAGDAVVATVVERLHQWLIEIESARYVESYSDLREAFGGAIDGQRLRTLERELRSTFLALCNHTPSLASSYLQALATRPHTEQIVRGIVSFRGALAKAAPTELAALTSSALIPSRERGERRGAIDGPFTFVDHELFPPAPEQGPFFELLKSAPTHGLALIRKLIDRAIDYHTDRRDPGENVISIEFPTGTRNLPWQQSYNWSRQAVQSNCVTSALMALETWAHSRIEARESVDAVLSDVLGAEGAPAAYLLVAVDLLISHWPKTSEAAIPFVACPRLLCLDHARAQHDIIEAQTGASLHLFDRKIGLRPAFEHLMRRRSRRQSLRDLCAFYALGDRPDLQQALMSALTRVAGGLGAPDKDATLSDEACMARNALNLSEPSNWKQHLTVTKNGMEEMQYEYVEPADERDHFERLRRAAQPRQESAQIEAAISLALDDPGRSSAELAAAAVKWAQLPRPDVAGEGPDDGSVRDQSIPIAALILVRDGDDALRAQHLSWAQAIFDQALALDSDPVLGARRGLRFNAPAMAFAGVAHSLKLGVARADSLQTLLYAACRPDGAAANAFDTIAPMLASIDERISRAILRCAFSACIRVRGEWDLTDEEIAAVEARQRERLRADVEAELAWLTHGSEEPSWPVFPAEPPRVRRGIRITLDTAGQDPPASEAEPQELYVNHQLAAIWLDRANSLFDVTARPWLRDVARHYGPWTGVMNGAGLPHETDIEHPPMEWNHAYFHLVANCLPGLALSDADEMVVAPIASLPDESFFDVGSTFIRSVDSVYFADRGLSEALAVGVRAAFATRLKQSRGWQRLAGSRTDSIEFHIAPAIAVQFFNDRSLTENICYLLPGGAKRLTPFMPVLADLVASAPCLFVALLTCNLIEVSPQVEHLEFVVSAASTWLAHYADDVRFWVDSAVGRRLCAWLENIWRQDPTQFAAGRPVYAETHRLLAALVSLGLPEGRHLEDTLAGRNG